MIKIQQVKGQVYIGLVTSSSIANLQVTYNGNKINIYSLNEEIYYARGLDYSLCVDIDGNSFASITELQNYMNNTVLVDNSSSTGLPQPYIASITPAKIVTGQTANVTVMGDFFTPDSTVNITGVNNSVDNVVFISSQELLLTITVGTVVGFYNLEISNGVVTTLVNALEVFVSTWVDLATETFTHGSNAGNDIRYRIGMSMVQDSSGLSFLGSNPWSSWVKFESLAWSRGANSTLSIVMTRPTSSMMVGIGSTSTNETNTAQYTQGEVLAYFSSATNFWGLYGNSGTPGATGNQSNGVNTAGTPDVFKLVFTQDGGAGGNFKVYKIPSTNSSDWDDESNLIINMTIAGSLNPQQSNIMPFIIPRSASAQRFLAIKVE